VHPVVFSKGVSMTETLQVSCVQLHWAKTLERNLAQTLHYIRQAAEEGSRVVCFPEATLTSYYFPYLVTLKREWVIEALAEVQKAAAEAGLWVIVGAIQPTHDRFLNLAHVINPAGQIIHEYAKTHMAGVDESKYCRPGNKISFFAIDGIPCTLVICRDGRHPELYRLPAMAGAKILFQPSCSSDSLEAVHWKRVSGRAQQPAGPNSSIFHCVANTIGQSPDGEQSSSGQSFIKDPTGLPLAEAGWYEEGIITATLKLSRATGYYALDSLEHPAFLKPYWEQMIAEMKRRADDKPE
jgi:predicted amidohydrolase